MLFLKEGVGGGAYIACSYRSCCGGGSGRPLRCRPRSSNPFHTVPRTEQTGFKKNKREEEKRMKLSYRSYYPVLRIRIILMLIRIRTNSNFFLINFFCIRFKTHNDVFLVVILSLLFEYIKQN